MSFGTCSGSTKRGDPCGNPAGHLGYCHLHEGQYRPPSEGAARGAEARAELDDAERELQAALAERREVLDALVKSHLHAPPPVDWRAVLEQPALTAPERSTRHADPAHMELFEYEPGLLDRVLFRASRKGDRLRRRLREAQDRDDTEHEEALRRHRGEVAALETRKDLARRVLGGDVDAYEEAFTTESNIQESLLASDVFLALTRDDDGAVAARVDVVVRRFDPPAEDVVARDGVLETRALGTAGRAAFYEDYVCSAVLRMGREALAALPLERVTARAVERVPNEATGHDDEVVLAWAEIDRVTLDGLNLSKVDPSEALANFPCENTLAPPPAGAPRRSGPGPATTALVGGDPDDLLEDAAEVVARTQRGSVSLLQRELHVGYTRAAHLVDQLEALGVVGPFEGSADRDVLVGLRDVPRLLRH